MTWNKDACKQASIGIITSIILIQSIVAIPNVLAQLPSNAYKSINGEKDQIQMQKVSQNDLHITATTFGQQQQQSISPQIDQNQTQNVAKSL